MLINHCKGAATNPISMMLALIRQLIQTLLLAVIRAYQYLISPFLGNHCRYYPTCSCYARTAIQRFGPFSGGVLALKRLSRCHPFHAGGYDPVPPSASDKKHKN